MPRRVTVNSVVNGETYEREVEPRIPLSDFLRIHMHPGANPSMVPWLLEKKIKIWGVDAVFNDHPMNLPIGRFLGKDTFGQGDRDGAGHPASRLGEVVWTSHGCRHRSFAG